MNHPALEHKLVDGFGLKGEVKWIKSKNGKVIVESPWMQNKVLANADRGIYLFLDRLVGITTYTAVVSHADIGDDNTPATSADTGCGNALVRASISSVARSTNTATFRFFFSDALTADDTYEELAMIVDGTASLGTGRAFNHLIFTTPLVKSAGEDHTIVVRVTGNV